MRKRAERRAVGLVAGRARRQTIGFVAGRARGQTIGFVAGRAGLCAGAAVAVLLLIVLATSGCSAAPAKTRPTPTPPAAVTPAEVRSLFDTALTRAAAHDAAGWRRLLPAEGAAYASLGRLYGTLRVFSWTTLRASVDPIPREPTRFDVVITGAPDGFGPPDRLIAERVLVVERRAGRLTVTGDVSPPAVSRLYLAAFDHPIAVKVAGALVIGDRVWRPRVEAIAGAVAYARATVRRVLDVKPARGLIIFVFDSRTQLNASLNGVIQEPRVNFISFGAERLSTKPWWPSDILVVAPALNGKSAWLPLMVAHEMTHGYTMRWFFATKHAPLFLEEGLATAVEGGRTYAPLRAELASGNKQVPLLLAFAYGTLWSAGDYAPVLLGYLEAGAIVKYVLQRWGPSKLRTWVVEVANTDLSAAAVKRSVSAVLGVDWGTFVKGWQAYVQTLP